MLRIAAGVATGREVPAVGLQIGAQEVDIDAAHVGLRHLHDVVQVVRVLDALLGFDDGGDDGARRLRALLERRATREYAVIGEVAKQLGPFAVLDVRIRALRS